MDQRQIFLSGEGDAWYQRNTEKLKSLADVAVSEDVRYICKTLTPFKKRIGRVLKIGCSNGVKLEAICHRLDAHPECCRRRQHTAKDCAGPFIDMALKFLDACPAKMRLRARMTAAIYGPRQ